MYGLTDLSTDWPQGQGNAPNTNGCNGVGVLRAVYGPFGTLSQRSSPKMTCTMEADKLRKGCNRPGKLSERPLLGNPGKAHEGARWARWGGAPRSGAWRVAAGRGWCGRGRRQEWGGKMSSRLRGSSGQPARMRLPLALVCAASSKHARARFEPATRVCAVVVGASLSGQSPIGAWATRPGTRRLSGCRCLALARPPRNLALAWLHQATRACVVVAVSCVCAINPGLAVAPQLRGSSRKLAFARL